MNTWSKSCCFQIIHTFMTFRPKISFRSLLFSLNETKPDPPLPPAFPVHLCPFTLLCIFLSISLSLSLSFCSQPCRQKRHLKQMKHLSEPFNTSSVHSLRLWSMKKGSFLTSANHSLHQCLPTRPSVDELDITAKQATSILQKQLSGAQRTGNNN